MLTTAFGSLLLHLVEGIFHNIFYSMAVDFALCHQCTHVLAVRHLMRQTRQQHAPNETTDTNLHIYVIGFIPNRIIGAIKLFFNLFD